jgi:hypothetical protein
MGTRNYLQVSRDIAGAVLRCAATTGQAPFMVALGLSMVLSGCALSYETTKSPRAPSEQLLLTQSLKRSLIDAVLPLRPGQTIAVETVGLTTDQAFVSSLIEKWLSRGGLLLPKDGKEALVAKVTLEAFGTLQDQTFFGIPPIGGGFIPLSLPELTFYKAVRQRGHARLSIDFIEKSTGRLVSSTPLHEGNAYYNQYTFLFAFNATRTDLLPPLP